MRQDRELRSVFDLKTFSCNCVCLSVSGEVFDSSTAESSPAPSANGASKENMVTPTPTRPRTTDDLFAAIHRYHGALLVIPSSTLPPTLLIIYFNSQYIIHSSGPVHFPPTSIFLFSLLASHSLFHKNTHLKLSCFTLQDISIFFAPPVTPPPSSHNFSKSCPICQIASLPALDRDFCVSAEFREQHESAVKCLSKLLC